jgi:hypothetical protein
MDCTVALQRINERAGKGLRRQGAGKDCRAVEGESQGKAFVALDRDRV